jgi:hypothetical protein
MALAHKELVSPELDGAFASNDTLSPDPAVALGERATWRGRSEMLRGRLSTQLEFAMALSVYPGAGAPKDQLDESHRELVYEFVELREAYYQLAGLDPEHVVEHRPEAFKLARVACKWVCRLWRLGHADVGGSHFSNEQIANFMRSAVDEEAPTITVAEQTLGVKVAKMSAFVKLVDAVERFDFYAPSREDLVYVAMRTILDQVDRAIDDLDGNSDALGLKDHDLLREALILNATDLYVSAYLAYARHVVKDLKSLPKEEAAWRLMIWEKVGAPGAKEVSEGFSILFDRMLALAANHDDLLPVLGAGQGRAHAAVNRTDRG